MKNKITIIVPIYQAKRYLEKCIKSICNQTYDNIEILLIDDGSTDGSMEICEAAGLNDSRIQVIHQTNSGVSAARNKGLDISTGDYVMFVDADDYIAPSLCKTLLKAMIANPDIDLVISGFIENFEIKQHDVSIDYIKCTDLKNLQEEFDIYYKLPLLNAPFAKLYKKKVIQDMKFETSISMGEDFLFNLRYYERCNKIIILPNAYYYYNQTNVKSATRKYKEEYFKCYKKCYFAGKEFKYGGIHFDNDALDQAFCTNCLGLVQIICYQKADWKWKKNKLRYICNDELFCLVCKGNYSLSMQQKILKILSQKKQYMLLKSFVFLKKMFIKFRRKRG